MRRKEKMEDEGKGEGGRPLEEFEKRRGIKGGRGRERKMGEVKQMGKMEELEQGKVREREGE